MKTLKSALNNACSPADKGGSSSTPLDSQKPQTPYMVSIDWLSGTFWDVPDSQSAQDIITSLAELANDHTDLTASGQIWFANQYWNECHVGNKIGRIYVMYPKGEKKGKLYISLSGKPCQEIGSMPLLKWLKIYGRAYDFRCTRIDNALDDFTRSISPAQLFKHHVDGNVAGVERKHTDPHQNPLTGITQSVTYGSPKSKKQYINYDKFVESNGRINAYRHESHLREGYAVSALGMLLTALAHGERYVWQAMINIATSVVDFVEKKDKNRTRDVRLPDWQEFLDMVGANPVKIVPPKVTWTVQKSIKWVDRTVATTLAGIKRRLGDGTSIYLEMLMEDGEKRLPPRKKKAWDEAPISLFCT